MLLKLGYAFMLFIVLALFPCPLRAEDVPPGVDPVLLENLKILRKEWKDDLNIYKDKIQKTIEELKDSLKDIRKRLVEDELDKEERKKLFKRYQDTDKLRQKLDSDEDVLQAATIVLWANRKERIEDFFTPD
jgi:hypothetical protein